MESLIGCMSRMSDRSYGTFLTVLGVLILCPDTLLLREVSSTNLWTVIFYRHLFFAVFVLLFVFLSKDGNLPRTWDDIHSLGWLGLLAGIVQGISMLLFTIGVEYTAAANVVVINATNPVFSSIFSYFILRELIPLKTIIVIIISFVAILIIFSGDFGSGPKSGFLIGNLCAVGAAVSVGLYFVLIRLASIRM